MRVCVLCAASVRRGHRGSIHAQQQRFHPRHAPSILAFDVPLAQREQLLRELERERSRADVLETRLGEITRQFHEVRVRTRLRSCRSAVRWL